jgi:ComF family protein
LVIGQVQCAACIRTLPPWDDALTAVAYEYPWSQLVVDFKFRQEPGWARNMALLMRSAPWVEPALDAADLLVPMPLSHQRLRERGFNQALLLARALSAHKTHPRLLIRIKDTPAQSSLPRAARLANVQHAFATDPLRQAEVEGRRVVLIDDVMTSGASLGAAARSLRQAGAAHITTLVFARAEPGH